MPLPPGSMRSCAASSPIPLLLLEEAEAQTAALAVAVALPVNGLDLFLRFQGGSSSESVDPRRVAERLNLAPNLDP